MEEEEFERRWRCKRQVEGAGGEGGKRGLLDDEGEEAEQRPSQEENQVQQQKAAPDKGVAGGPAGGEAPLQGVQAAVAQGEREAQVGYRRSRGLPPSLSHHRHPGADSLDSRSGLVAWRRQPRQLVAAGVSAAEAVQPVAAEEAGQGGEVEEAGSEEEDLPPVHHKAWEAERLRALNGVLSAELQPEDLLLEAVEAP